MTHTLGMVSGLITGCFGVLLLLAWAASFGLIRIHGVASDRFDRKRDRVSVFFGLPALAAALISIGLWWTVAR